MSIKYNLRSAFAFVAFLLVHTSGLGAETLQAGGNGEYQDVCSAIAAAVPGDVIEVSESATSSHCVWTTANLTIKGVGARPAVKVAGNTTGWSIAAENTVIENIAFEGSRCEAGSCAAIELLGGSLALRNVSISGSDIGVQAYKAEGSVLSIDHSEIFGNTSNIRVGAIERFALISSYIHDSLGGAVVETAAAENTIRNNRLVSGAESTASGELTLAGNRKTVLTGNVLVRLNAASTAGLLQYIYADGEPGEILAEQNTFVSAATSGIEFMEAIGERAPSLLLERNIFWGDAPSGLLANTDTSRNYFGIERVFRADADFHLEGDFVPEGWGAASSDDNGFPLSVSAAANRVAESKKGRAKDAITGVSPSSVVLISNSVGGASFLFNNTVNLTGPAPVGGVTVAIATSNAAVVRVLTPAVAIPAGATSGKFSLQTILPATPSQVTITASANGGSAAAAVQVGAVSISKITIGATQIGSNAFLNSNRIELTGPAPAGGVIVALRSSSPAVIAPASITVPAGMISMNFNLNAGFVTAPTTATITASHTTVIKTATLTVVPVGLKSMYISPVSTSGGQTILVKAYLNGPAPVGGLPVTLTGTNSTALPVPGSILVPAGALENGVLVNTAWVSANTPVTVTGVTTFASGAANLTVIPTQLSAIAATIRALRSLGSTTVSVNLSGPAPTGGITVYMTSSAPGIIPCPASVFIPAGATAASVVVKANSVLAIGSVTITATAGGATKTLAISVAP